MDSEKLLAIPMAFVGVISSFISLFWVMKYNLIYPHAGSFYWYIFFFMIAGTILSFLVVIGAYVKKDHKNTVYKFTERITYLFALVSLTGSIKQIIEADYITAGKLAGVSIAIVLVTNILWRAHWKNEKQKIR